MNKRQVKKFKKAVLSSHGARLFNRHYLKQLNWRNKNTTFNLRAQKWYRNVVKDSWSLKRPRLHQRCVDQIYRAACKERDDCDV